MLKKLPRQRRYLDYTLDLMERTDKAAIYSMSSKDDEGKLIHKHHYEVVRIRTRNTLNREAGRSNNDDLSKVEQMYEIYPSPARWGRDGFTYNNYEDAKKRYNKLNEKLNI